MSNKTTTPMDLTPAMIAKKIEAIIQDDPDSFQMDFWGYNECDTIRCIAGWTGFFHNDFIQWASESKSEWLDRQAARLNLDTQAAGIAFSFCSDIEAVLHLLKNKAEQQEASVTLPQIIANYDVRSHAGERYIFGFKETQTA